MPLTLNENVRFRQWILDEAEASPRFADELVEACRDDLLFYVNTFHWTHDPRKEVKDIPFIMWPYQGRMFLDMHEAQFFSNPFTPDKIGRDLLVEKSRDMGWSWAPLMYIDWRYRFYQRESFLLVSRNYDYVWSPGDMDALFTKFDFLDEHLPEFLQPKQKKLEAHRENKETRSTVDGTASTANLARGGRKTAVLRDEDAAIPNGDLVSEALGPVTNCQFRITTPDGPATAFERDKVREGANLKTYHWSAHPHKGRGLYMVTDDGQLTIIDKEFWTPERMCEYEFVRTPPKSKKYKFRSPIYDAEEKARSPRYMAKNWDIDSEGSESLFFDASVINKLKLFCREPDDTGILEYDLDGGRPIAWRSGQGGNFICSLWFKTSSVGAPPRSQNYAVGADVSGGMGRTNSVLSVAGMDDGVKIAEFATPFMRPEHFAVLAVAVCRWFRGPDGQPATLNFEINGPGNTFADVAMNELQFRNFYRRDTKTNLRVKYNDTPGWAAGGKTGIKRKAYEHYRAHLESGAFTNYSALALDECLSYVNFGGSVEHVSQTGGEIDPSEAKDNHGDRVTADMLADMVVNHGKVKDEPAKDESLDSEGVYPLGTFGWRREQRHKREREAELL